MLELLLRPDSVLEKGAILSLQEKQEYWEFLLKHLRFDEIKILEFLYLPQPTSCYLAELVKKMGKYNIKRTAIRNKISRLAKAGLIDVVNSGLLCLNSFPGLYGPVKRLIALCRMRFGLKNDF